MLSREYFIKNSIEVYINDMKKGKTLFSRDYSICNAIILSDGKTAALAHISNATSPEMLFRGYVSTLLSDPKVRTRKIDSINEMFRDIEKLSAYHIYRPEGCWSNHDVLKSLNDMGIKKTISFPIHDASFRTRDIGVSMKEHEIYIFPRSYSCIYTPDIIIPMNIAQ